MRVQVFRSVSVLIVLILCANALLAQSTIPSEYRGDQGAVARGVLEGNNILTNYRNHGEMARFGDLPWGEWYSNICDRFDENCESSGGPHIDGIGFILAAEVLGEREKWSQYYGEGVADTTLNPVIMKYRERRDPNLEENWGWLPLNGFHNPLRRNSSGVTEPIPATNIDERSWPSKWPDRLDHPNDPGWAESWNGFRGKGLATGDQETFYVMDDFSDKEYALGIETEGPHSPYGVYYPSPSDSSIGGLGTQVEVRHFQFNDVLSSDMLFTQYRVTNVSEKDLDRTWSAIIIDVGLGEDTDDDNLEFLPDQDLIIMWDEDGLGLPITGSSSYETGYVGFLLLEHSTEEENGIDDDQDGIIDESRFNGPGQLITGREAIDEYLSENYNMDLFKEKHLDLNEFPAYAAERWWTGDEDMDWVAHDDFNGNGEWDEGEIYNDVGRDGLGPWHEHYPGPDEGEGDGIPTQGEPNFGEQDMMEAETGNLSFFDVGDRTFFESADRVNDDSWMFERITSSEIDPNFDYSEPFSSENAPIALLGVGPYSLKANTSSYFTTVLIFGEDREELLENVRVARLIHESDYGQSKLLTSNEPEPPSTPTQISLAQNYPNPFNPTTNIEFTLNKPAEVSLRVFDITGREVRSLVADKRYISGTHTVQFDASNLASGIYIYQLRVNGTVHTNKLTLIK